jgi:hypothetical protein
VREREPLVSAAKALSVVTPCKTREQFIERYHRFCDDTASFFVATKKACVPGQELTFSFQLADRTAILRGAGSIEAAFQTGENPWQQPGIKIRIRRMTANSTAVFAKLQLHAAVASIDQLEPAGAPASSPAPDLVPTAPDLVGAEAAPAPAPESSRSRAPVVRFATSSVCQVDPVPAATPERDASEAPLVDLVECMIYEADDDVLAIDENLIDLELAPAQRLDETPLAFPVEKAQASPVSALRRFVGKPVVGASILSCLVAVFVSVIMSRREEQPSPERVVRRSAAANPYARHKTARLPAASARTSPALPSAPAPAPAPSPVSAPAPAAVAPSPAPAPSEVPAIATKECSLQVEASPKGASVSIDGRDVGSASRPITTTCGPHEVEISRRRYATAKHSIVLTPDQPHRLEVSLERPLHTVTVETTPPDALITIAGEQVGTSPSPLQIEGFRNVTLTISKPGWRTTTQRVYSKVPHERIVVRLSRK